MVRPLLTLLAAFFLLVSTLPAQAADAPDLKNGPVGKALVQDFPQLGQEVEEINPTQVPGLYEVVARKGILYFFPDQGYILVGELYDKTGASLTRQSYNKRLQDKLASLPLDEAIKIGSGKNVVIEFTDPECPYCRRGAAYFANRTDVTRYVFLFPLSIHPHALEKAKFILSSADPAKTYEEVMAGKYDQGPLPEFKDNGRIAKQISIGEKLGINSTPIYFINGQVVSGANTELLNKLLSPATDEQPATQAPHGDAKQ